MFHHLMYKVTAGVNDVNVDMTGVPDTIFTVRSSNHFMLPDRYQWLAAAHLGVSVLRCRTNIPSWNNFGRHQIWPVNRFVLPPSPPRIDDYRAQPLMLPVMEEIALEESGNLGAATEAETTHLWIGTMDWSKRTPRGLFSLRVRCTATVVTVAGTWAGATPIVLADNLIGGWYAVVGAYCFEANTRAFRLIFPHFPSNLSNRNLRPGSLCVNATGNIEAAFEENFNSALGVWGAFHTTELPSIELFDDGAGSRSVELRLEVVYLGPGDPGGYPSLA